MLKLFNRHRTLGKSSTRESSSTAQNASLSDVVNRYLDSYAAGTSHTARAKRLDASHFLLFLSRLKDCGSTKNLKVKDWDFSSTQRFVDEKLREGEAPATVTRRLATIKHMGRTLAETVPGFINPARDVRSPKVQVLAPKSIPETEIADIRDLATERHSKKPSFIRFRNQVILNFMLETGLRADEVRLLLRGQVDANLEWITKVRTKGRRFRNVYIPSTLRPILEDYLAARDRTLKKFFSRLQPSTDRSLPLFISTYGADAAKIDSFFLGAKTLWRAVNELSTSTRLHPHLLRHSFAHGLLESSNDIRLVAQALGHSDMKVTMRYTERSDRDVAAALEDARKRKKR